MEAKELRIGNIIKQGKIELLELRNNEIVCIKCNGHYVENHEPIPLTKQWLLDFEFEYNQGGELFNRHDICFSYSPYYKVFRLYINHEHEIGEPIIYVHQLQNLYFALKGEELELK